MIPPDLSLFESASPRHVIYIPVYQCANTLGAVLAEVPDEIVASSFFLIIDNHSEDQSAEIALTAARSSRFQGRMSVIRTRKNLGYAGSQKLAYRLCKSIEGLESVIMLHGDGQYPPLFLPEFRARFAQGKDVVYGYRSRKQFGAKEETPAKVRLAIKVLGALECAVTRQFYIKEWHSGLVGYSGRLLRKIPVHLLTNTRHFDGNMLFQAGRLRANIDACPIYKRYRHYVGFGGSAAFLYILHTLVVMFKMQLPASAAAKNPPLEWPDFEWLNKN